ncbi:hypothetical protein SADUNF_Sadunf16G0223300 [Salix dunnii]|uniref:cellulase n=1 Tax=Salix dunnii TaxID=1413687 RepID=A0A835JCM4_9ROSI|nr:hypothetical protein SADUNF_Sadunf16G0223300 [Salix dunnii]
MLWAAAWLHRATNDEIYLDYLGASTNTGGIRTVFSWDDKFLGAQLLVAKGSKNVKKTPGGLLWFLEWDGLQYVATASLVAAAYAQSQVDYILGSNPKGMSYMDGFGSNYPTQPHHRGASIVTIKKDPKPVTCQEGYRVWFNRNAPNPNVLDGPIVGGPDEHDAYIDTRSDYQLAEPATVTVAPLGGVLARVATN